MSKASGKVLTHLNLEEEAIRQCDGVEPVFINELSLETEADQRFLESLTVTTHDSAEVLHSTPSCQCKKYQRGHYVGVRCEVCNTVVSNPILREIKSDLWIAAPAEIGALFSPLAWIMLSKPVTTGQFNGLAWMCNPFYPTPDQSGRTNAKVVKVIRQFEKLGIPRGLRSVLANFDRVLELVIKHVSSYSRRASLAVFMEHYRSAIFTRVLPLPSKVAMIVEKTSLGNYYDSTIDAAVEAAFTAADTAKETNVPRLEARFTTVMQNLGTYYMSAVTSALTGKKGWLRHVLYGNRLNFSYRDIITSRHEPHEYDTLKIPYHQLLTVLQPIVVGKMIKEHSFNLMTAYCYVLDHAKDKDPFLWELLEELIDSTPPLDPELISPVERDLPSTLKTRERKGRGILTTLTRFPSLDKLSTQLYRIVGMTEHDIQISVLTTVGHNADFD